MHSFAVKYPDFEETKEKPAKGVKEFLASLQNKTKNGGKNIAGAVTAPQTNIKEIPSNPLLAVISFLESLTYTYDDGRIHIQKSENRSQSKLQFLLLNPSIHFKEIVEDARSVISTGVIWC